MKMGWSWCGKMRVRQAGQMPPWPSTMSPTQSLQNTCPHDVDISRRAVASI